VAQNEVEFLFKARDEVSRVLASINSQITGTAATATATGNAMAVAGRKTSEFTSFINEQRREQRMQNFLFREGSQAIGAASIALTAFGLVSADAGESTKRLNAGLNQGFIAFQGVNFLLARANPTLALTTSALAGLGAVMLSLKKDVDGAKESLTFITKLSDAISKLEPGKLEEITAYFRKLADIQNQSKSDEAVSNVVALEQATAALNATLGPAAGTVGVFIGQLLGLIPATEKSIAAASQLKMIILDPALITADPYIKLSRDVSSLTVELEGAVKMQQKLKLEFKDTVTQQRVKETRPNFQAPGENSSLQFTFIEETQNRIIENFKQMGQLGVQVGDVITNTMTNAAEIMAGVFTGAITRIDEAFKALIQSMIAELIKIGLLKLFAGIVSGGGSVVGDVVGSSFGKTVAKPVPAEVGGSTVNIYVTPEARSVSVADRRRAMAVIEKAMYTEK
jgi:hypothetical protein